MNLERELLLLLGALLPLSALSCGGNSTAGPELSGYETRAEYPLSGRQDSDPLFRRIKAAVDSIRLIDTHEHLISESLWLKQKVDFFYWFQQPWFPQYAGSDLVSAGMPEKDLAVLGDTSLSDDERWAVMAPYWPMMSLTAYGQALRTAARELHGVDRIDSGSWRTLNERIREAHKPGFYEKVLHDKAGIDLIILDRIVLIDEDVEENLPPRTVRVRRFDQTFISFDRATVERFSAKHGLKVSGLDDWLALLDLEFREIIERGYFVGIKNSQAYDRPLSFENVPKERAAAIFARLMESGSLDFDSRKPLEDFMMHAVAERAGRHDLTVQVHTGIQAGPGNDVGRSDPMLLLPLIQAHPETRFALFHGSFPYMHELGVLAKNYRNVYIDMCWMYVLSPTDSRDWLARWLETVPVNKILGFGGDYLFPEGSYAHGLIARRVVAEALCRKVEEGYLSLDEALWAGRRILRENAIELFRLQRFL